MEKKLSIIEEVSVVCGKCGKEFCSKLPYIINHETDAELTGDVIQGKFLLSECSHCGYEAMNRMPFLFHDPTKDFLAIVIVGPVDSAFNGYLQMKEFGKNLLKKYLEILPQNNHYSLKESDLQVLPYVFLQKRYSAESIELFGNFLFFPLPKIKFFDNNDEKENKSDDFHLKIIDNNYSERTKELMNFITRDFQFAESYLPTQNEKYKGAVGTYGVSDILLYVSSSILLPIVLGVVSNQLSKVFLDNPHKKRSGKEKAKYEFEKDIIELLREQFSLSEELSIIVYDESTQRGIKLNGTIDNIIKEAYMQHLYLLFDLYIPGNCHTTTFVNDYFLDSCVDDEIHHSSEFSTYYKKHFAPDTRVHVYDISLIGEQSRVAGISKELINQKKHKEALDILLSINTTNKPLLIDYAYNLGVCYRELEEYDKAYSYFYHILHCAILAPSIESVSTIITYPNPLDEEGKKRLADLTKDMREAYSNNEKQEQLLKVIDKHLKIKKEKK